MYLKLLLFAFLTIMALNFGSSLEIISANSECFNTGTEGVIRLVIDNSDGETYGYNAYAECESPFTSIRNTQGSLYETTTILIPISNGVSQKEYGQCAVTVEGVGYQLQTTVTVCGLSWENDLQDNYIPGQESKADYTAVLIIGVFILVIITLIYLLHKSKKKN